MTEQATSAFKVGDWVLWTPPRPIKDISPRGVHVQIKRIYTYSSNGLPDQAVVVRTRGGRSYTHLADLTSLQPVD